MWINREAFAMGDKQLQLGTSALRVLWAFQHLHDHYGRATLRDVAALTDLALSVVNHHMKTLVRLGYVEHHPKQAPAFTPILTLVAEGARSDRLP